MLIKTSDGWKLAENSVIYSENGEQKEKIIGEEGKGWWLDYAERWSTVDVIEFADLHYTPEQLGRLAEIQSIRTHHEACEDYVLKGFIADVEPFEILRLQKKNSELEGVIADLIQILADKGVVW